jgi:hypothetical protein
MPQFSATPIQNQLVQPLHSQSLLGAQHQLSTLQSAVIPQSQSLTQQSHAFAQPHVLPLQSKSVFPVAVPATSFSSNHNQQPQIQSHPDPQTLAPAFSQPQLLAQKQFSSFSIPVQAPRIFPPSHASSLDTQQSTSIASLESQHGQFASTTKSTMSSLFDDDSDNDDGTSNSRPGGTKWAAPPGFSSNSKLFRNPFANFQAANDDLDEDLANPLRRARGIAELLSPSPPQFQYSFDQVPPDSSPSVVYEPFPSRLN